MHMGMIPLEKILGQLEPGIPHACGGVSMPSTSEGLSRRYSPHMWGWFSIHEIPPYLVLDIPHSCGDVPHFKPFFLHYRLYSPMYMGMVLSEKFTFAVQTGIPHAYWDDSENIRADKSHLKYSPRMWGCFHESRQREDCICVFPTYAGMISTGVTMGKGRHSACL